MDSNSHTKHNSAHTKSPSTSWHWPNLTTSVTLLYTKCRAFVSTSTVHSQKTEKLLIPLVIKEARAENWNCSIWKPTRYDVIKNYMWYFPFGKDDELHKLMHQEIYSLGSVVLYILKWDRYTSLGGKDRRMVAWETETLHGFADYAPADSIFSNISNLVFLFHPFIAATRLINPRIWLLVYSCKPKSYHDGMNALKRYTKVWHSTKFLTGWAAAQWTYSVSGR